MSGKRSVWFGGAMALAVLAVTLLVGGATVLAKKALAEERTIVVAQAPDYHLFKVISAKDEIIIGLSQAEAEALGRGAVLDNLAQRLADHGQITVWQFSTRKAADGQLELAGLRRVAIMKSEAIRIEPYKAALRVVPPST